MLHCLTFETVEEQMKKVCSTQPGRFPLMIGTGEAFEKEMMEWGLKCGASLFCLKEIFTLNV